MHRFITRVANAFLVLVRDAYAPGVSGWAEFSKRAGVDASLISRIRNGDRGLNYKLLDQLSKGLDVPISKLFTDFCQCVDRIHDGEDVSFWQGESYVVALSDDVIAPLRDGDVYYFVTMSSPWEVTEPKFEKKVVDAILRGVKFVYVVPDVVGESPVLGMAEHLLRVGGIGLPHVLNSWVKKISRQYSALDEKTQKQIERNVKICPVGASEKMFLFAPFLKYVIIKRKMIDDDVGEYYVIDAYCDASVEDDGSLKRTFFKLPVTSGDELYDVVSSLGA